MNLTLKERWAFMMQRNTANFAGHQLTVEIESPDGRVTHWLCRHPETGAYHFRVKKWPGYLFVHGDIGACAWRMDDEPIDWVRRAINSLDYMASKVIPQINPYEGDSLDEVEAWLTEKMNEGTCSQRRAVAIVQRMRFEGFASVARALERLAKPSVPPRFCVLSYDYLWVCLGLTRFLQLLHGKEQPPCQPNPSGST